MLERAFNTAYAYETMSVGHKEKLIELVKLNPGLWKQNRKAPGVKQQLWDAIALQLGTTGYDARRQWEILRDQLRRENKRFKENPHYKSKWTFYTKMLFLQNDVPATTVNWGYGDHFQHEQQMQFENCHYLEPKIEDEGSIIKVRKDLQEESNDDPNHSLSMDGCSPALSAASPVVDETFEDYYPSKSAGVSSSTQHRRYTYNNAEVEPCATRRSRTKRHYGSAENEEDYYFAMSLVPSLRCIPRSRKLRVRSKILDLIASALEENFNEGDGGDADGNNMSLRDGDNVEPEDKIIPNEILQVSMKQID